MVPLQCISRTRQPTRRGAGRGVSRATHALASFEAICTAAVPRVGNCVRRTSPRTAECAALAFITNTRLPCSATLAGSTQQALECGSGSARAKTWCCRQRRAWTMAPTMVRRTLSGSAWSWTTSQRTVMAPGCIGAPSMAARGVLTWCGTTRTTAARTLAARRAFGATWMFSVWTVWCSVCQATSALLALRHRRSLSRRPRRRILRRQRSAMCRPAWSHRPSTLASTERSRRPVRSRRVHQVRAPLPGMLVAGAC